MRVFISHSFKDRSKFDDVCYALENAGIDVWTTDEIAAGKALPEGLRKGIESCALCVFIATRNSVASDWCQAETGAFWGARKPVVVYIGDDTLKSEDLPKQCQPDKTAATIREVVDAVKLHLREEAEAITAVAALVKPTENDGEGEFSAFDGRAGDALTAALVANLAGIIQQADPAVLAERMLVREKQISLRRQFNFEHVAALALDLAQRRPKEDRRPIDEDWFVRWFEAAEQVSDATVQNLWARAFDQQTDRHRRPLSLRALDTLRQMEREDILSFRRAVDLFDYFGIITVTSTRILRGIMDGHRLDSLLDLNLVTCEEYRMHNIALPGGFGVYFRLEDGALALDPLPQYRLTARGRELALTLPPELKVEEMYDDLFDVSDPLVVAQYINLFADGLDNGYRVSLAINNYEGRRPPTKGLKRTHEWDHGNRRWVRFHDPETPVSSSILAALEEGYGTEEPQ